jgi:hypothetical protein
MISVLQKWCKEFFYLFIQIPYTLTFLLPWSILSLSLSLFLFLSLSVSNVFFSELFVRK